MKSVFKKTVLLAALVAAGAAHAGDTLTFDGLGYVNPFSSYTESGYVFSLITPNPTPWSKHIGDAGSADTFNWHDDGDNGIGAYITVARVDGAAFNLHSFDWASFSGTGLVLSAAGHSAVSFAQGSGTSNVNWQGLTSITFSSDGYNDNQLDNISLSAVAAVPEPESYALFLAGLGLMAGVARRRRSKA